MTENVSYHNELNALATSLGLVTATSNQVLPNILGEDVNVLFLLSISSALKSELLETARLLVYTPKNEHFGIVPLESMLVGTPVLAAASGGPMETIVDGQTGWLRATDAVDQWTSVMQDVLTSLGESQLQTMGAAGKERVKREFSKERMAQRLDRAFHDACNRPRIALLSSRDLLMIVGALVALSVSLWQIWSSGR